MKIKINQTKFGCETIRLCLVTIFIFYFKKLVFGNINKKQFSCIFEIKKHVWLVEIKKDGFLRKK